MGFVANFIRFPEVQKFWTSVKIWQSYRQLKVGTFLRYSVFSGNRTREIPDKSLTLSVSFVQIKRAGYCKFQPKLPR